MSRFAGTSSSASISATPQPVALGAGRVVLDADLALPAGAGGVVVFAHGSGSGRHSPRNRQVAGSLQARGMGTLLLDLLTPQEQAADEQTAQHRFDIALLAERLDGSIEWLSRRPDTLRLRIGLFGASTGAAAALVAAARNPGRVHTVVSRGGRPDLAGSSLPTVRCPTLLVVGERDAQVLTLNREAMSRMHAPTKLQIVPGATHLFEEPGAMEAVSRLAGDWFEGHLLAPGRAG